MKSLLASLLLVISFCYTAIAQVKETDITQMMSQKVPDRGEISYNTAKNLPRLYREGKQDTLKAVVDYYLKTLGLGYTITPYLIIEKINKRSFNEDLPNFAVIDTYSYHKLTYGEYYEENIFKYIEWYRHLADMVKRDKYDMEINDTYEAYITFIRNLAQEQINKAYLSPVEKFLLQFYINPTDSLYSSLTDDQYNGTRLQKAYTAYKKSATSLTGMHTQISLGAWRPNGNLSLLGTHPEVGFSFGGRVNKFSIDAGMNFRFVYSDKDYIVRVDTTYYNTNYFFGGYIGLNAAYELYRKKAHEFAVIGGFGYDGMDALPGNNNNNNNNSNNQTKGPTKSLNSANANIGLEYRLYIRKTTNSRQIFNYLGCALKYNYMHYDNAGGTNLNGNAIAFTLIYGAYSCRIHHFYNDPLKYYSNKEGNNKVNF